MRVASEVFGCRSSLDEGDGCVEGFFEALEEEGARPVVVELVEVAVFLPVVLVSLEGSVDVGKDEAESRKASSEGGEVHEREDSPVLADTLARVAEGLEGGFVDLRNTRDAFPGVVTSRVEGRHGSLHGIWGQGSSPVDHFGGDGLTENG